MNKEDVEKWCEENNHLLINLNKKQIPAKSIILLAEVATNIDNIRNRTRQGHYAFARNIAVNYLYKKIPNNIIAQKLNIGHDVVNYYMNKDVLNEDAKYLTGWQREAVVYFKDKIKEIESSF